jgi:hypothetical protein
MSGTFYGVDVSHHQVPKSLDWTSMQRSGVKLGIARATYGLMVDRTCREHLERMRDAGVSAVSVYHFFRPDQDVDSQMDAFLTAARAAGYGKPTDALPILDLEADTEKRPLRPSDAPNALAALLRLEKEFGRPPVVYTTQREWRQYLGAPHWIFSYPLHVAHYSAPSVIEPATPNGMKWEIWQHRVGLFQAFGQSGFYKDDSPKIDQNRVRTIRLLNGTVVNAKVPKEETFPDQRKVVDIDGTHLHRAKMLDQILRAEAQYHATESTADNLEALRKEAHREMMGDDDDGVPSS